MEKKGKILIADDNIATSMTLELKLKEEGFETTVVSNGKDALDLIKKEKFDLVLLDLIMPQLNGFGVLEGIQREGIKIPVIVSSNLGQNEDIQKVKELGALDFFIKSDMSMTEMVEKIKGYIKP